MGKKKKYSNGFERDFSYYLKWRNTFTFSGGKQEIVMDDIRKDYYDRNGIDGKRAFLVYDSTGKLRKTRHPELLCRLINTKAAINLQIKQWAQGRAEGTLPGIEFSNKFAEEEISREERMIWIANYELESLIKKNRKEGQQFYKNVIALSKQSIEEANKYLKATIQSEFELLDWMVDAVEQQKKAIWATW